MATINQPKNAMWYCLVPSNHGKTPQKKGSACWPEHIGSLIFLWPSDFIIINQMIHLSSTLSSFSGVVKVSLESQREIKWSRHWVLKQGLKHSSERLAFSKEMIPIYPPRLQCKLWCLQYSTLSYLPALLGEQVHPLTISMFPYQFMCTCTEEYIHYICIYKTSKKNVCIIFFPLKHRKSMVCS